MSSLQTVEALKNLIAKMTSQAVDDIDVNIIPQAIDQIADAYNTSGGVPFESFYNNLAIDYKYDTDTNANYTIIRIYKHRLDGSLQYPFVVAPNGANACEKTSLDVALENGFFLTINAGIFDTTTHKADGMLIENGKVLQNTPSQTHPQCRPLTIDNNGDLAEAAYNANANALVNSGVISAVCGFMAIVKDYAAVPSSQWNNVAHYSQNAQRQIIGQFGNGDYAVLTCEGRGVDNSDGWTIEEAQQICIKHGLKFAYDLDGGGSTELVLGEKPFNHIYEGVSGRGVPTFIVFNGTDKFEKNETPEPTPGPEPTPVKTLTSITATKSDVIYNVDDTLATNDIVVTAHYSDNTSANVTSSATINTSNVDMSAVGNYNILISYTYEGVTKNTTIAISVESGETPEVNTPQWVHGYSVVYPEESHNMYASLGDNRVTCVTQTPNNAVVKNENEVIIGYLIPVPSDATKIIVNTPKYYNGLGFYNDQIARVLDDGWGTSVGSNTKTFTAGQYAYVSINVKNYSNSTIEPNVDVSQFTVTFE